MPTQVCSGPADPIKFDSDPPRGPQTFAQAIQLFWLYALHAGTWNYGRLDLALGPFLKRDLENGEISQDEALELVCSLWKLMRLLQPIQQPCLSEVVGVQRSSGRRIRPPCHRSHA